MTDARVEEVHADRVRAREFLAQADRFRTDADAPLSAESQAVLLHNAALSACDAILQAVGLRVTGGERSHILRSETALEQLDGDARPSTIHVRRRQSRPMLDDLSALSLPDAAIAGLHVDRKPRAAAAGKLGDPLRRAAATTAIRTIWVYVWVYGSYARGAPTATPRRSR